VVYAEMAGKQESPSKHAAGPEFIIDYAHASLNIRLKAGHHRGQDWHRRPPLLPDGIPVFTQIRRFFRWGSGDKREMILADRRLNFEIKHF